MERRTFLQAAGTVVAGTALAGCSGGSGGSTGTLATRVSDQPGDIDDFERCVVTITEVTVKPADGEERTEDIDDTDADLTELQGSASKLAGESDLPTGEYEYIKVGVADEFDAVLTDGSETELKVPSNGLKFNQSFEIREDETTIFTADFTPVKRGQSNGYLIQPVASETTVRYEGESTTDGDTMESGGSTSEDGDTSTSDGGEMTTTTDGGAY